jgi:hypothetical protein
MLLRYVVSAFTLVLLFANGLHAQQTVDGYGTQGLVITAWEIHLEFVPIIGETVPGYHSFAYATYGSKWLLIGGRTNGLHGLNSNSNFETEYANNNIIVIDTVDWQWSTASLNQLSVAHADPLRSTNMQFSQKGDRLYIVGGYGWDSTNAMFTTFPFITAVDVPGLINAVETGDSISPHLGFYLDSSMAVSGGELEEINDTFYIVGGHKFEGRYSDQNNGQFTQTYTDAIRSFTIVDIVPSGPFGPFNQSEIIDTNNFHRRDLNVVKLEFDEGPQLAILGGVFRKDKNLPFTKPMYFDGQNTQVFTTVNQRYNQYTSANFTIYDDWAGTNDNAVILIGGMGTHKTNDAYDSLVPFVKTVSLLNFSTNGPDSLFGMWSWEKQFYNDSLPGYLGTNAIFVLGNGVDTTHGAISRSYLPFLFDEPRKFVGYLFGGIRGTAPNNAVSSANDTIYRVYVKGELVAGVEEIPTSLALKNMFPNPATDVVTLQMDLKKTQVVSISVLSIDGKKQQVNYAGKLQAGNQNISLNTTGLAAGMYFIAIETPEGRLVKKLTIAK